MLAGSGTVCTWGSYFGVASQSCQALPFPLAQDRCSTSGKMGVLDKGLAAWLTVTKVLTPTPQALTDVADQPDPRGSAEWKEQ
jgi:hypothetical protein